MKKLLPVLIFTWTLATAGFAQTTQPICFTHTTDMTANSPASAFCADFNQDGNKDLAFCAITGHYISVFMSNGNGTFSTASTFSVFGANHITGGDFNNDGSPDLAVSVEAVNGYEMAILLNNGSGTFSLTATYTVNPAPYTTIDICSGDFDHDNNVDLALLVSSLSTYPQLLIFPGNGSGAFPISTSYSLNSYGPNSVITGKFNNDAYDDIAIPFFGGTNIFLGSSTGTLTGPFSYTTSGVNICSADFNNDGFNDLAMMDGVLLGSSSGSFTAINSYSLFAVGIAAQDFDGDLNQDLAFNLSGSAGLVIMRGLGTGSFSPAGSYTINSTSISELISSDFNNDTKPDIVTGSGYYASNISVFINGFSVPTIASSASSVCPGTVVTLTAVGIAGTYSWSNGSSGLTTAVTPSGTSIFTVTVSDTMGCHACSTTTINTYSAPVISISGNSLICLGESTTLTASGATSYSWSNSQTGASTSFTPDSSSVYLVTGINSNSCATTQTILIQVPQAFFNISSSSSTICTGESATLSVSGVSSFSWSNGQQGTSIIVNPTNTSIYSVTGTSLGCTSPPLSFTLNVSLCTSLSSYTGQAEVTLYPNPFYDHFVISNIASESASIFVFNTSGEKILAIKQLGPDHVVDLSSQPQGIYLIKVLDKTTGRNYIFKTIKQD